MLLACAVVWQAGLGRRWTERIPPWFSIAYDYMGTETFPAPGDRDLPADDVPARYERRQQVSDNSGRPQQVVVEDRYTVRAMTSDTILFEYVTHETVDPATGAHATPGRHRDILLFPRETERRTYWLRGNYVKGIPLAFERVDHIEGLETFVFSYSGPAEYTESYASTAALLGVTLGPGQEIRCADDGFRYRTWIEPATGAVVKVEEGCTSGDYVFDVATGARLNPIDRWSGVTTARSLFMRATYVRTLRTRYLLASRYLPGGLALGGVMLLVASVAPRTHRVDE